MYCDKCSTFAIVGEDQIPDKLISIRDIICQSHENWNPSDHVEEFVEITKHLLFIAQGNPYAPVTGSNVVDKTVQQVEG